MAEFNVIGDFTKAALGPFTNSEKQKVWNGAVTQDFDTSGKKYSIVEDSRFSRGRACRMKYPEGQYGMQDQSYGIRIKSPRCALVVEFDWLLEDGFQFYNPSNSSEQGGGGKIGPCINWGEIGGDAEKRGTRCMWWYNAQGSNKSKPCFMPTCQDQRSGNQLLQPTKYTPPLQTERLYHFRIEMQGGPASQAYAKYEQDGVEIGSVSGKDMMVGEDDDVIIDFAFFAGGQSESAPNQNCYARHGGVKYYSLGSASSDGVTIELDGTIYQVSGALVLKKVGP